MPCNGTLLHIYALHMQACTHMYECAHKHSFINTHVHVRASACMCAHNSLLHVRAHTCTCTYTYHKALAMLFERSAVNDLQAFNTSMDERLL